MNAVVERIVRDRSPEGVAEGMLSGHCVRGLLTALDESLAVAGDVIEVGCFRGHTAALMRQLMDATGHTADRSLRVFDSFLGLNPRGPRDGSGRHAEGMCRAKFADVLDTFERLKLLSPLVTAGRVEHLPADVWPRRICFAFIDLDFYGPTHAALSGVWPRLNRGGAVVLHDYGGDELPGVKAACDDFFSAPNRAGFTAAHVGQLGVFRK